MSRVDHWADVRNRSLSLRPPTEDLPPRREPGLRCSYCGHVQETTGPYAMQTIVSQTAADFGLLFEDLVGHSRTRDVTAARHRAMLRCHEAGKGPTAIGRFFGDRDHSTVLAAIRKLRGRPKVRRASP